MDPFTSQIYVTSNVDNIADSEKHMQNLGTNPTVYLAREKWHYFSNSMRNMTSRLHIFFFFFFFSVISETLLELPACWTSFGNQLKK